MTHQHDHDHDAPDTTEPDSLPWLPLAWAALAYEVDHQHDRALSLIEGIHEVFGPEVIPEVMIEWIDMMTTRTGLPAGPQAVMWLDPETGEAATADDVDPADRWAGRLILARGRRDREMFEDLVLSVADNDEWAQNVQALIGSCASMIREVVLPVTEPDGGE